MFLVFAPAGRDAMVLAQLLGSAGLECREDADGELLLAAIAEGAAGGAVVTDDALMRLDEARLRAALERQPPWSDFPILLLTRRGEVRQGSKVSENLLNLTVLERPLHPASLLSAARAARRARGRQRLAAQHLEDRENARAALRELADTLEAKVAARTHDLAAANDRLVAEIAERQRAEARLMQAQKMEAVGQLTGGIAHDFNNLLTAVIGSLHLLLRRTDDERVVRLARMALEAGERGATLTAQLLAFSRRQRLLPVPVHPNEIVAGMSDLLERSIGATVQVETVLDPELWQALADPTQLEVMILNLAINARDAMPRGGRITISTRNVGSLPGWLAGDLAPGEYVAIQVADTGTGMSPEVVARAFEPFFTTKEQGKGTGLGLAQIYGFAQQSGGTVRIESAEGRGTTVSMYLPRTDQRGVPKAAATPLRLNTGHRARILVVDDDDDVRQVAAQMVEEIGYEVATAASGEAALACFGPDRFSLVLSDVAMPGMTGMELARRIRLIDPAMPILFASGYADVQAFGDDLLEESVLKKPFSIAEVAERIGAILGESESTPS